MPELDLDLRSHDIVSDLNSSELDLKFELYDPLLPIDNDGDEYTPAPDKGGGSQQFNWPMAIFSRASNGLTEPR